MRCKNCYSVCAQGIARDETDWLAFGEWLSNMLAISAVLPVAGLQYFRSVAPAYLTTCGFYTRVRERERGGKK